MKDLNLALSSIPLHAIVSPADPCQGRRRKALYILRMWMRTDKQSLKRQRRGEGKNENRGGNTSLKPCYSTQREYTALLTHRMECCRVAQGIPPLSIQGSNLRRSLRGQKEPGLEMKGTVVLVKVSPGLSKSLLPNKRVFLWY